MSKFKDMVARDNARTFMNLDEFAEKRIVVYDLSLIHISEPTRPY